jgi:hypothetical protein
MSEHLIKSFLFLHKRLTGQLWNGDEVTFLGHNVASFKRLAPAPYRLFLPLLPSISLSYSSSVPTGTQGFTQPLPLHPIIL